MGNFKSRILSFEGAFIFLALLNIWPIWSASHFPTLDGPSHVYNAKLLSHIFFGNEGIQEFFAINAELVPNWIGHLFMALFLQIGIPAVVANKLMLSIIAFGIPLVFFRLSKRINGFNNPLSLLSLIFVYTFLFSLGFYNFGFGILFSLLTIHYHQSVKPSKGWAYNAGLFLLIALCYFSHIVAFGIVCIYFFLSFLSELDSSLLSESLKKNLLNFVLCVPFLLLSIVFLIHREAPVTDDFFSSATLWALLVKLKIFVLYGVEGEVLISQIVFYLVTILFLGSLVLKGAISQAHRLWLFIPIILIGMFFLMPDVSSNGSFISQRLLIFSFWFLLLFLCRFKWTRWINIGVILLVITIQAVRTSSFDKEIRRQYIHINEFEKASDLIEPNAVVLDIWKGKHFSDRHFSAYLGYEKPIVLLDNYEAHYGYFPIIWKDTLPRVSLANASYYSDGCINWPSNESSDFDRTINYIIVWGDKKWEPCEKQVQEIISSSYQQIYVSKDNYLRLFASKDVLEN